MKYLALLLLAFTTVASGYEPTLIGGSVSKDYPQIVYIRAGNSRCSATVVSPKTSIGVILTAGHCVVDRGEVGPVSEVVVEVAGASYSAVCRQSPEYHRSQYGTDMALCVANRPFKIDGFSVSQRRVKLGETVLLTGYGCVRSPGTGGNDGNLRVGKAKVIQDDSRDSWFQTRDKAALCSGDSGSSVLSLDRVPVVIGVNSRANMKDLSLLTSLARPEARKFMASWVAENGAVICGINKDCSK